MIVVKTLKNSNFIINAFLIQKIESLPDTTITLTDGKKYIVKNEIEDVIKKSIDFFKSIYQIDYKSQFMEKNIKDIKQNG